MKRTLSMFLALLLVCLLLPLSSLAWEGGAENDYYFDQLDANEKAIYEVLSTLTAPDTLSPFGVIVYMPESTTRYTSCDFVQTAVYALWEDRPLSTAWIGFVDAQRPDGSPIPENEAWSSYPDALSQYDQLLLQVTPCLTAGDVDLIDLNIEGMTDDATAGMSRYERAKFAADKVASRLVYDHDDAWDAAITSSPQCILYGYAICEGFSKVYKIMADKLDLPCVLGHGRDHMYVQVQMEDGSWYVVEPQGGYFLSGLDRVAGDEMYVPQTQPVHWVARDGHGAVCPPPIPDTSYVPGSDSQPGFYSSAPSQPSGGGGQSYTGQSGYTGQTGREIYGYAANNLSTRTGPSPKYQDGGTYTVKGQYIRVLAKAWDKANGIWWVKCEIPYAGEIRVLWTGYWRFDPDTLSLDDLPEEFW